MGAVVFFRFDFRFLFCLLRAWLGFAMLCLVLLCLHRGHLSPPPPPPSDVCLRDKKTERDTTWDGLQQGSIFVGSDGVQSCQAWRGREGSQKVRIITSFQSVGQRWAGGASIVPY